MRCFRPALLSCADCAPCILPPSHPPIPRTSGTLKGAAKDAKRPRFFAAISPFLSRNLLLRKRFPFAPRYPRSRDFFSLPISPDPRQSAAHLQNYKKNPFVTVPTSPAATPPTVTACRAKQTHKIRPT